MDEYTKTKRRAFIRVTATPRSAAGERKEDEKNIGKFLGRGVGKLCVTRKLANAAG